MFLSTIQNLARYDRRALIIELPPPWTDTRAECTCLYKWGAMTLLCHRCCCYVSRPRTVRLRFGRAGCSGGLQLLKPQAKEAHKPHLTILGRYPVPNSDRRERQSLEPAIFSWDTTVLSSGGTRIMSHHPASDEMARQLRTAWFMYLDTIEPEIGRAHV